MSNTNCIVLADKHQNILEGLRGLLETFFGGVVMVADQPSLVEALNKIRPEVAIVDLSLLKDGDFARACYLKERFADVKIIVLSDYDDPDIIQEVMATGVLGFISKRHAGTDLFEAIQCIERGETYISPALKTDQDR